MRRLGTITHFASRYHATYERVSNHRPPFANELQQTRLKSNMRSKSFCRDSGRRDLNSKTHCQRARRSEVYLLVPIDWTTVQVFVLLANVDGWFRLPKFGSTGLFIVGGL